MVRLPPKNGVYRLSWPAAHAVTFPPPCPAAQAFVGPCPARGNGTNDTRQKRPERTSQIVECLIHTYQRLICVMLYYFSASHAEASVSAGFSCFGVSIAVVSSSAGLFVMVAAP